MIINSENEVESKTELEPESEREPECIEPKIEKQNDPVDFLPYISDIIKEFMQSSKPEKWEVQYVYGVVIMIVVCATGLAWCGVLEGQAIAGFFGAAIGYLLTKKQA